jgi:hypothetical protein
MHRTEADVLESCAQCGAEIDASRDRAYGFRGGSLCYACAMRRGGSYDELHDVWTQAPDVEGLRRRED